MAESLNEPFDKPSTRFSRLRGNLTPVILVVSGLASILVLVLLALGSLSDNVSLKESEFVCSKPTATSRYRFDRPETCDQYTRRPEMTRWNR